MPVFLLALIPVDSILTQQIILLFVALHVFVYPASNAINSYYDQDEGSIGGLENPPDAEIETLAAGLVFNLIGLAISGFFINLVCGVAVLLYSLVSFAYSHPKIRLKAHPVLSTMAVSIFQGPLVVLMVWLASGYNSVGSHLATYILVGSALLLAGSYPLTQLYQIDEDVKRGDNTIASRLGALGTINFSGAAFLGFALCMFAALGNGFSQYWPYMVAAMLPGAIGVGLMLHKILFKKKSSPESGITFRMIMWQNMASSTAFILAHIGYLVFGR